MSKTKRTVRKAPIRAAITGVFGHVPPDVLTNAELAEMIETSDEWITERTGIKERRIRLEILTLGRDIATVNLEFKIRDKDLVGRQSQTWVKFPDAGWRVIAAHVSTMDKKPLW